MPWYDLAMENLPNPFIDKLIGLPKEHEGLTKEWHGYIIEDIRIIGGRKIENFEIEKSPKDVEIIKFTEKAVNSMLAKYGRKLKISVPLDNIHVLKPGGTLEYTNNRLEGGAHSSTLKSIIVDRDKSDVQFALKIFHELIHLKAYSALQIIPGNDDNAPQVAPYRTGIAVISRDGKTKFLENVEEAIVGHLTSVYFETTLKHDPLFKEEIEQIAEGKLNIEISRREEMEDLNIVIQKIISNNPSLGADDIMDEFIKAQINGTLISLSRLIENTFGKGAMRKVNFETLK